MAQVIVVHADVRERARISRQMQQMGWTVFPAATGHDALRALSFFAADALLYSADITDVPAETVPALLAGHPATRHIAFAVLHAADDAEVFFLAQQAGADRLVREDLPADTLSALLVDAVETRRRTAAAVQAFRAAF